MFEFLDPGLLTDGLLQLKLRVTEPAHESMWNAPTYRFDIQPVESQLRMGHINLRTGSTLFLTHYVGHIGYGIDETYRGHHYAEAACRLLLPFAGRHGMNEIWITCSPDNIASRRTLDRLGAEFVETVPVPPGYPLPPGALREKCRYRVVLSQFECPIK